MTVIRKIWLQQPIAFARVGISPIPAPAFRWSGNDLRPRGSGKTMILPSPTYSVDKENGTLMREPDSEFTLLKDEKGIRPVCPFFELHGEWDGQTPDNGTALTLDVLKAAGVDLKDLKWTVHHANHKAYSLTHDQGDRIEARLSIPGNHHSRVTLQGRSPDGAAKPLIPSDQFIPMGEVQVVQPTPERPGIRFRFYAPPGHAYGPTNLQERLKKHSPLDYIIGLFKVNDRWKDFKLPRERCILNADASWTKYQLVTYSQLLAALPRVVMNLRKFIALLRQVQLSELARFVIGPTADAGKLPPGLYASWAGGGAALSSLGIVDDLGDGIITCEIAGVANVASARIVVAPPHFSPDRRPPISIADQLADRELRKDVRSEDWTSAANWPELQAEIDDLLDRAFETESLSNLDAWNKTLTEENTSDAVYRGDPNPPKQPDALLWPDLHKETVLDLPLSERGRWRHRRNTADEFFEQLIRDDADLFNEWIRTPDDDESLYYDRRMPALMRGSDRRPLHLTRRQLESLRKWIGVLRKQHAEEQK
jgi:hypothetical protein